MKTTLRSWPASVLLILLAFSLTNCSSNKTPVLIPEGAVLNLEQISIQAAPFANNGRPVPLDVVFAYEEKDVARLQGYTAKGWFSVKNTKTLDWEDKYTWLEMTVNPGEEITITEFPKSDKNPLAVGFFANYNTRGLHRFLIVGGERISVLLAESTLRVSGQ